MTPAPDPREEEIRRWMRRLPADHPLVQLLRRLALARRRRGGRAS